MPIPSGEASPKTVQGLPSESIGLIPDAENTATATSVAVVAAATVSTASDGGSNGPFRGDGTHYSPALGSCGLTNSESDPVVALSQLLYDTFP
jgi:hypothetical protein